MRRVEVLKNPGVETSSKRRNSLSRNLCLASVANPSDEFLGQHSGTAAPDARPTRASGSTKQPSGGQDGAEAVPVGRHSGAFLAGGWQQERRTLRSTVA